MVKICTVVAQMVISTRLRMT